MTDAGVALVTGGSRSIGRAIVELLAARGYRVLFTYLRNEAQASDDASAVVLVSEVRI
jgi:NAD(P)-dependent dehydrogenase (short-subunit alcohol dehydrogenase family)